MLALGPAFVVTVVTQGDVRFIVKRPAPRLANDARARAMMTREATALEALGGHGAPRLVASGEDEHGPFVVSSLCAGKPLADYVHSTLTFPTVASSVLAALATVHARGVVHGDPSPANVLVDGDRATFVDFGLSSTVEGPGASSSSSAGGAFAGTLAYAAPEVARDGGDATSPASDVFAIAVVALEIVTARRVRPALPAAALLVHAVEVPIEGKFLDEIIPGLSRALSPDPSQRPLAEELAAAANAKARASGAW